MDLVINILGYALLIALSVGLLAWIYFVITMGMGAIKDYWKNIIAWIVVALICYWFYLGEQAVY